MPYVVADRVKETSTSTGTGNFTLAGAATGFRTFSSAIGNGNTTTYVITNATGSEWEVGFGTLSGGTTLARTRVFSSSNAGSAVNFSAGAKSVFVSMSAAPFNNNTALGTNQNFDPNSRQFTTVIGFGASAFADYGTVVGQYSTSNGSNAVAIGGGNSASATQATVVGTSSSAFGDNSVALGYSLSTDSQDQFSVRVRVDPVGVEDTLSLKYDNTRKEVYASSSGGGGGVTQIVAGTGISITSTGPSGTGIVTINAGAAPASFDWFTRDLSPVDGIIQVPTNFTTSPSGVGDLVVAGFTDGFWGPSGPWFSTSTGGWFGSANYVVDSDWSFVPNPTYSYASSVSQGLAFNYVQYPAGHSNTNRQDVNGSASSWFGNFGASYGTGGFPAFGSSRKLFGVFVISTGPTDLSGVVSVNPSYPGTTFTAYYDPYSGVTVVAFQNLVDSEVSAIVGGGGGFIAWGGSPYSYYGHVWYEYS